jgi:histidyl-tRNA synthetase
MAQGALPGFRDFYPEQFAERAHIMGVWRDVARRFAFVEYDGPPLEPLELYTKKSGDEIVGQLYNFVDKGGRDVALRPEMTPTLARMASAKANALRKPIRWFSVPQLFRYERQQRGRLREHFQLNVDIIGETDVTADAELLAVAIEVMRGCGLSASDVRARVSDRRLLRAILDSLGVASDQVSAVFGVRVPEDFPFTDEIRDWAQAGIETTLTISRPEGTDWSGDTGYVQTYCEEVMGDLDNPVALVCGMKDMMAQSRDELCRLGVDNCDVLTNY